MFILLSERKSKIKYECNKLMLINIYLILQNVHISNTHIL